MKDCGSLPELAVWFLWSPNPEMVAVIDTSNCRVAASCLLPILNTTASTTSLAMDGCKRIFYSSAVGFGQLLPNAASIGFFPSSVNRFVSAFDPTNERLAVLTQTQIVEIDPLTWLVTWATNHGLTVSAGGCGIDVDRSGNVAIAANGTVQVYDGATGAMTATAAQAGASTVRFDAEGSIYVAGTNLIQYAAGLASTQWTNPATYSVISVGDLFAYGQHDTGTGSFVDIISRTNGSVVRDIATLSSPCAIPDGRAIALSNSLGFTGPTVVMISSGGIVSSQGDRLPAWSTISGSGPTYTRTGPTISEPSVGRIGAYAW